MDVGTALETYFKAFISIMPCGYAPMNIPVLAPYRDDKIDVNIQSEYYSFTGSISNIYISGLDKYTMLKFDYNPKSGLLSYDSFIPELQILAESDMDYWIMVGGYKMAFSGKTLWDVKYENIRSVGNVTIAPNSRRKMQLTSQVGNVYLGDVQMNNWVEGWNIAANNYHNDFMRSFHLMLNEQTQALRNELYAKYFVPFINKYWERDTKQEFITYLISKSAEWSLSGCKA